MKHLLLSLSLALLPPPLHLRSQPTPPTQAWVVHFAGPVSIKKAVPDGSEPERWVPLTTHYALARSDSIRTEGNATARLLYRDGSLVLLGPGSLVGVGDGPQSGAPLGIDSTLAWLFDRPPPQPTGLTRGADRPLRLYYPREGLVLTREPAFKWLRPWPGAPSYHLQLYVDYSPVTCQLDGALLAQVSTATDTALTFAQTRAATLTPGQRYWVQVRQDPDRSPADHSCFRVATDTEAEILRTLEHRLMDGPDHVLPRLQFAVFLARKHYYTDALLILEEVERRDPAYTSLPAWRNHILDLAGLSQLIRWP